MDDPRPDPKWLIGVRRYGALGGLELDVANFAKDDEEAQASVDLQIRTMCPEDRAEIEIKRLR